MKLSTLKIALPMFLAALLLPATRPAQAEGGQFDAISRAVAAASSGKPGNSLVSVTVIDVVTGQTIYENNGNTLMNPASNAKVITAATALKVLGPEFRYETSLYGRVTGTLVSGPLYIKGHGDPSLFTSHLYEMIRQLRAEGVQRVEDGIVVDDTYFDGENLPFAFDQQPNEDNQFRAPIGAVSLNHNALEILIRPAQTAMVKAVVTLDPPGYAVVANDSITVGQGAHDPRISATPFENRTRLRVWGQIPLGSRPVRYYRRIDNPSLFTGYAVLGLLKEAGITVGGDVRTGQIPAGTPLVASHSSEPLSSILWETGKMSNNFVTESIFKTMGAETGSGPGTWKSAEDAVAKVLSEWGIPAGSYQFKNGSGLFDANKISSAQFCKVLRGAWLDATIRPEFLAQLATGGVDGTIKSRYTSPATKRLVRAKTGTLDDVATLTGYVIDRTGQHPVAFSILVNRASGYVSSARTWQEKIVSAIAAQLNPEKQ